MTTLDEFLDELQGRLDDQARQAYGEKAFERWRNPPHQGRPAGANCEGASTGSCGDTIRIFLHVEGGKVEGAGFDTDGCAASQLCGSMTAELALGKGLEEAAAVSGEAVRDALGALPEKDEHCAFLAASALQEALGDHYKQEIRQAETD